MVPYALNQKVEFLKGEGPILEEFNFKKFLDNDKISFTQKLHPVYKAIEKTREKLDKKKSLIGFIGAPWTLLIYILGAKKSKNDINYKIIKEKEFEVNLILINSTSIFVFILKIKLMLGLMLYKFLIHGQV